MHIEPMQEVKWPTSIIVIGAGIVGSSIAFELATRGAQVRVLDADQPGQGASSVSFAWINARNKNPRHYHDLNRRSLDMWDRFARRLNSDIGLTWGGELRWSATPEGAQMLKDRVKTLQSWSYPIQFLGATELKNIEPGIRFGTFTAASYSTADGHVNTYKVVRTCLSKATNRGAVVSPETKATGLEITTSTTHSRIIKTVRVGGNQIPCDAVVLAGGPDSPELASHAGINLPLHHTFGATVITEPIQPILQRAAVIHSPQDREPQIALRQFNDGSVMIHGGEGGTTGESLGKTEAEIGRVIVAASQYIPALKDMQIKEVRKGRRPMPKDGHPIIGFTQSIPNLYLAVTHSGVTLAPLISEFAAIEILDGVRIDLLEPYRLERFTTIAQ